MTPEPAEAREDQDAQRLARRYESTTFEAVHAGIIPFLPSKPARVLDVGAGSGRDAAALCRRGHDVTAVEPSLWLRTWAEENHRDCNIEWLDDRLPSLMALRKADRRYDFILCAAVLMYLGREEIERAFVAFADLLDEDGRLAISLRSRLPEDATCLFSQVSESRLVAAANAQGLRLASQSRSQDLFKREGASWSSFVFERDHRANRVRLPARFRT